MLTKGFDSGKAYTNNRSFKTTRATPEKEKRSVYLSSQRLFWMGREQSEQSFDIKGIRMATSFVKYLRSHDHTKINVFWHNRFYHSCDVPSAKQLNSSGNSGCEHPRSFQMFFDVNLSTSEGLHMRQTVRGSKNKCYMHFMIICLTDSRNQLGCKMYSVQEKFA